MDQYTSEIPYGYCHCGCGQKTTITPFNNANRGWVKGEPRRYINHHYKTLSSETVNRFWTKVAITSNNEKCWEWQAGKDQTGYGRFRFYGKQVCAHRVAYEHSVGEIPDGLFVLHKCDNRGCVNPNHLFLGTIQDNVIDMHQKGRGGILRGELSNFHKLTLNQVKSIRERYAAGGISQRELATEMGVTRSAISFITLNKNWKDV